MNINDVVNEQMKALCESGEIEGMVKKALTSCVERVVEDQLCSYSSPIKKQLEEAVKEAVKIDMSVINLSEMTSFMNDHAIAKLREVIGNESSSRFMKEIDKLMKPLPDTMTINDLVERIISAWNNESDKEDWSDYYSVELTENDGVLSGSFNLEVSVNSNSRYSSSKEKEISLYIYEHDGKHQIRISHRMHLNPTCLHDDAEQLIYRMYCQGVEITGLDDFDVDDIDTEVQGKDYY